MKNYIKKVFAIITILSLHACSVEPQPIKFGTDACSYCKMTIVDKMHASEYVTDKGKVYKYDAVECMIHDLQEKNFPPHAYLLVADYGNNGTFTDAEKAVYLISKKIPSPMGAFLSAFSSAEKAEEVKNEKGGELYSWKEIIQKIKK
jgi:copper chaperone NosL